MKRALLLSTPQEITIVTNAEHRFLVRDQLAAIGCNCRVLVEPVGRNTIARTIKSYFAVIEGDEQERKVISDVFNYTFDLTSERSEEREVQKRFTLSTKIRNSDNVFLVIEERVEKSNKWITLLKFNYRLSLAMENDFDDF